MPHSGLRSLNARARPARAVPLRKNPAIAGFFVGGALFAALLAAMLPQPAAAQGTAMRPGVTRGVTAGAADTASSADYLGWIAWRSAAASPKTQSLPACAASNNGMWIGIIDEQATAASFPISVTAAAGTVNGAAGGANLIASNGGGVILACDGATANWNIPAKNAAAGGGGGLTSLSQGAGITLTPNPITATGTVACTTFGAGLAGCVPASGGGTTNFMRADGSWAAPAGGGGSGTIASSAVGTIPVYTAATTVAGLPSLSFSSGLLQINDNPAALPAPPTGTVLHVGQTNNLIGRITLDGFGTQSAAFTGRFARGTAASPSAVLLNDVLTAWNSFGYGTTGYSATNRGGFRVLAAESPNWTDTAQGTIAQIDVTGLGSTALVSGATFAATGATFPSITATDQAGAGLRCVHVDAAGHQSATTADCSIGGGGGLSGMTAGQIPIAASPSTVTSSMTLSQILDSQIGSTVGGTIYRGSSAWSYLAPGSNGQIMQLSSGLPTWQTIATGGGTVNPGTGPQIAQYPSGTTSSVAGVTMSGDVSIAAGGLTTIAAGAITIPKINNGAVTYPKIQPMSASTLLGNPTGSAATPAEITLGTNLSFSGNVLNAAGGGGTANQSTGTLAGGPTAYTMAAAGFTANVGYYRACFWMASGIAINTGTATLAVGTAGALPLRTRNASTGILALAGGELTGGANGNTYCVQADATPSVWVIDNPAPPGQVVNPTSPYDITQAIWSSGQSILVTTAGTIIRLPNLTTTPISAQSGPTIQALVQVTLRAQGTDVINTGLPDQTPAAGDLILPANGTYLLNTSGVAGATAYTVPAGPNQVIPLSWGPGAPLNDRLIAVSANPRTIIGLNVRVGVLETTGITATVNLVNDGQACSAGTPIHSGTINLGTTGGAVANTLQTLTLTTFATSASQALCVRVSAPLVVGDGVINLRIR